MGINNNVLYSWGKNDWGQLGLRGGAVKLFSPQKVKFLKNQEADEMFTGRDHKKYLIKAVECGCYHTVAISVLNNIYSFGRNSHGQLSNGTTNNSSEPYEISISLEKLDGSDSMPPEP